MTIGQFRHPPMTIGLGLIHTIMVCLLPEPALPSQASLCLHRHQSSVYTGRGLPQRASFRRRVVLSSKGFDRRIASTGRCRREPEARGGGFTPPADERPLLPNPAATFVNAGRQSFNKLTDF